MEKIIGGDMSFKEKVWRIYTGDYSNVGYRLGENWAKQGKPRNAWGFALIWHKNFINQFWQANYSDQTLKDSFYQGYDNQQLAQTIANTQQPISPLIPQGVTMSNLERYDRILAGLNTARNNVNLNIKQLGDALTNYSSQIEKMEQVGFLKDYADKLKAYNGLKMRIDGLQNFLAQINKKIDDIEQSITDLRNNANNDQ